MLMNERININELPLTVLVGLKIKHIRQSLNLSQEEFAQRIGIHRTYLGQIERAEKSMSIKNIEKICKALNIEPKELFDFDDLV